MPTPLPRSESGTRAWRVVGSEIANWLFWQEEEDDGSVVDAREHERLVDVALRGGAVAKVGDDRTVVSGIAARDQAVLVEAHRVPRCVQRVRADDERVEVEVVVRWVPRAVLQAAEDGQHLRQVHPALEGNCVFAVARGTRNPRRGAPHRSQPVHPPGQAIAPTGRVRLDAGGSRPRDRTPW